LLTVLRRGSDPADPPAAIGYCGLLDHGNGSPEEPELAYELRRDAQGRGHATEAAAAVVAWADDAGYQRLWAGVWDWNTASRRVLHKLGFTELEPSGPRSEHGCSLLTVRARGERGGPVREPRPGPSR
jgi:RimJ/RimL family protein N-acetyltransferase